MCDYFAGQTSATSSIAMESVEVLDMPEMDALLDQLEREEGVEMTSSSPVPEIVATNEAALSSASDSKEPFQPSNVQIEAKSADEEEVDIFDQIDQVDALIRAEEEAAVAENEEIAASTSQVKQFVAELVDRTIGQVLAETMANGDGIMLQNGMNSLDDFYAQAQSSSNTEVVVSSTEETNEQPNQQCSQTAVHQMEELPSQNKDNEEEPIAAQNSVHSKQSIEEDQQAALISQTNSGERALITKAAFVEEEETPMENAYEQKMAKTTATTDQLTETQQSESTSSALQNGHNEATTPKQEHGSDTPRNLLFKRKTKSPRPSLTGFEVEQNGNPNANELPTITLGDAIDQPGSDNRIEPGQQQRLQSTSSNTSAGKQSVTPSPIGQSGPSASTASAAAATGTSPMISPYQWLISSSARAANAAGQTGVESGSSASNGKKMRTLVESKRNMIGRSIPEFSTSEQQLEVDSHLVCEQIEDEHFSTRIFTQDQTEKRKVAAASLVIFDGALKRGEQSMVSIFEDGLVVRLHSDLIKINEQSNWYSPSPTCQVEATYRHNTIESDGNEDLDNLDDELQLLRSRTPNLKPLKEEKDEVKKLMGHRDQDKIEVQLMDDPEANMEMNLTNRVLERIIGRLMEREHVGSDDRRTDENEDAPTSSAAPQQFSADVSQRSNRLMDKLNAPFYDIQMDPYDRRGRLLMYFYMAYIAGQEWMDLTNVQSRAERKYPDDIIGLKLWCNFNFYLWHCFDTHEGRALTEERIRIGHKFKLIKKPNVWWRIELEWAESMEEEKAFAGRTNPRLAETNENPICIITIKIARHLWMYRERADGSIHQPCVGAQSAIALIEVINHEICHCFQILEGKEDLNRRPGESELAYKLRVHRGQYMVRGVEMSRRIGLPLAPFSDFDHDADAVWALTTAWSEFIQRCLPQGHPLRQYQINASLLSVSNLGTSHQSDNMPRFEAMQKLKREERERANEERKRQNRRQ